MTPSATYCTVCTNTWPFSFISRHEPPLDSSPPSKSSTHPHKSRAPFSLPVTHFHSSQPPSPSPSPAFTPIAYPPLLIRSSPLHLSTFPTSASTTFPIITLKPNPLRNPLFSLLASSPLSPWQPSHKTSLPPRLDPA